MAPRHYLRTDFIHSGTPDKEYVLRDLWMRACQYAIKIGLDPKAVRVDFLSLEAALERYTRDIFGCQRVVKFIENNFAAQAQWVPLDNKKDFDKLKNDLIEELQKVGLRIPSNDPDNHKKCAFLLYYLTLMRPFSIDVKPNDDAPKREKKASFNAAVCAYIINVTLSTTQDHFFQTQDLIRDLTLRTLSRSAMEVMMSYAIIPKTMAAPVVQSL